MAESGNTDDALITVEVAYALPGEQKILSLQVPPGTTALQAVLQSGITRQFAEIDPQQASMGIFSRLLDGKLMPTPVQYVLQPGDRVEIYRPLQLDPKQARLLRAERAGQRRVQKKR